MMHGKRLATLAAAAAIALAWVAADGARAEEIDRTLEAARDGLVEIENVAGSVEVIGWDRGEVRVRGQLGRGSERLEFERRGDRIVVAVRLPRKARNVQDSQLTVHVPTGSRLEVSTVSARAEISAVEGDLKLRSVSGDITVKAASGRVKAEAVSGDIFLSVGGDLVRAESVSGDIVIEGARGEASAQSVSGDLSVEGGRFDRLGLESVSGDLRFAGELAPGGDFSFSSHSGDVRLQLAREPGAQFRASTFSGDIEAPFGREAGRKDRGPGRQLKVELGDGSGKLEIETFSGDIQVRVGR